MVLTLLHGMRRILNQLHTELFLYTSVLLKIAFLYCIFCVFACLSVVLLNILQECQFKTDVYLLLKT